MSTNLSRPEEIDLVLKEMKRRHIKAPVSENMPPNRAAQDSWQGAFISAYRSKYLKSHFDDL